MAGDILSEFGVTKFIGYDQLETSSKIIAIVKEGQRVDSVKSGDQASIFVESSPFYGEMGGQVGDTGYISNGEDNEACVEDSFLPEPGLVAHKVKVVSGSFELGQEVDLEVDAIRRAKISRNHTATHILH